MGVGAYSNTYCNVQYYYASSGTEAFISSCPTNAQSGGTGGHTNVVSIVNNCASLTSTNGDAGIGNLVAADTMVELNVPTALEMTFEIPVDVPSDRTEVSIDCSATITAGTKAQMTDA